VYQTQPRLWLQYRGLALVDLVLLLGHLFYKKSVLALAPRDEDFQFIDKIEDTLLSIACQTITDKVSHEQVDAILDSVRSERERLLALLNVSPPPLGNMSAVAGTLREHELNRLARRAQTARLLTDTPSTNESSPTHNEPEQMVSQPLVNADIPAPVPDTSPPPIGVAEQPQQVNISSVASATMGSDSTTVEPAPVDLSNPSTKRSALTNTIRSTPQT
jgi:hypothetical protein